MDRSFALLGRREQGRITTRDEAFRVLRSNVMVALDDLRNPIVVVTSAVPGEGKTSMCVTLARSLAAAGSRVVLVDLDLRHPDAHNLLGQPNDVGASDVLRGRSGVDEALQYVTLPDDRALYFLPAGQVANNPTELLGTSATGDLLDALSAQADIVLLDTPPVLPVADTLVIGRLAAGAILVVESRRTAAPTALKAKAALTRNQTRLLGVVLNKLQERDAHHEYGYGETSGG